ncbi:MAG TPA: Spy/CpxP family protein refolding chaperone [Anaeromyxobacteraceae bacterium]|nr:Spy/CpxP family protein refolding chaperone [Anaeromyxobacteraceae bacterium]
MNWKKTLAGGAAGIAAIALLAGFRGGCGGHAHGRDPAEVAAFVTDRVDDALDDLDATPEQRQRIHAAKDRLLSEGARLRGTRGETHREILAQWDSERPDAARLHALVDARIEEVRALAHQGVDAAVEVHATLTPEQRARVSRKLHRHAGEP